MSVNNYAFGTVPETTIVWDLDGTIVDSLGVLVAVLGEVLPRHGRKGPTVEEMATYFHGTLHESIRSMVGDVTPETMDQIMEEFLEIQDGHYEVIDKHIFPDALQLMRQFHQAGKRQIVVTNREHIGRLRASPRHIVANSEMANYIDHIVCGDDSQHRKPRPQVLDGIVAEKPIRAGDVLVVGDQLVDAELAQNIGGRVVLVGRSQPVPGLDELSDDRRRSIIAVTSLV